ncbi:hypothetical protein COU37_01835 [Candidatus Micrarchaeota archaeon CG10_big_fil_rev_8_21_14_0_10_45_29]|nr:MAG: hypothetical protein COU37_01835 [Candidatus Micrarchaeota archaeon CG10_big_fil_rev_8_21_14_0_10_45_29]
MKIFAIALLLVAFIFISGCINLDEIFPPEPPPVVAQNETIEPPQAQNDSNLLNGSGALNDSNAQNGSIFWDNETAANESAGMQVNGTGGINRSGGNGSAVAGINSTLANESLQINATVNGSDAENAAQNASNATVEPVNENLNIIFADVGYGDATILMANGYTVLIDAGSAQGADALAQILAQAGVESVDSLAISSWDEGRIGGLHEILRRFPVHEAWVGEQVPAGNVYDNAKENLAQHEIYTIHPNAGDEIKRGGISVKILNPQNEEYVDNAPANSIVMMVQYGKFCMLLPSALEQEMEPLIVSRLDNGCPVFKWSGHGEGRSTPSQLYARVSPDDVIISVGKNDDGLPSPTTIDRINISGAAIWRTDIVGSIYVNASKGGSYEIMPANLSAISQYNKLVN